MFKQSLVSMIIATGFAVGNAATASIPEQAVYFDAGQYSASLEQNSHRWHLSPLQGNSVDVIEQIEGCTAAVHIPRGVWIVTRDGNGQPQLVAPSSTPLPTGFPQQLALRHCGDNAGAGPGLQVSAVVFDWISANVGSVRIDD